MKKRYPWIPTEQSESLESVRRDPERKKERKKEAFSGGWLGIREG